MRQHPIPQDITNYKFHLIGSLTLKQFAEVAAAAILAFGINSTNLIVIVKWPLIFIVVVLGIMVAFVPLEDRPMDHWIITFFKNIYKPTKFFWKKKAHVPDFFNYQITSQNSEYFAPNVDLNPIRRARISEYLHSIPTEEKLDEQDEAENLRISEILQGFNEVEAQPQSAQPPHSTLVEKPQLKTRVRKLKAID
jgi:hypothetical protein